jgi:phosphatidate cytidylyltransferase
MLRTRIITAVFLLTVFLFALFTFSPVGWAVFATFISAMAAWEWGGLMRLGSLARLIVGSVLVLICTIIGFWQPAALGISPQINDSAWVLGRWFYLPSAMFWIILAPLWMRFRWPLPKSAVGMLIGALLIFPTWLALIQLRQADPFVLLAILAMIWLADIAAYFSGRAFGKHKLAPSISPGKTWEGAIGGGVAVVILGTLFLPLLPNIFPSKITISYVLFSLVLVVFTAISIIGDLFESMLKRQAGLKDSSNVLPGHGGVLDRIDSQTSTLPLVALAWLLTLA